MTAPPIAAVDAGAPKKLLYNNHVEYRRARWCRMPLTNLGFVFRLLPVLGCKTGTWRSGQCAFSRTFYRHFFDVAKAFKHSRVLHGEPRAALDENVIDTRPCLPSPFLFHKALSNPTQSFSRSLCYEASLLLAPTNGAVRVAKNIRFSLERVTRSFGTSLSAGRKARRQPRLARALC